MLVRAASASMIVAFLCSKIHNFFEYMHSYNRKWKSAKTLLESEVCQEAQLRMSIGEFDNCHNAELFTAISPVYRAVYSVAEEIHLCGNNRCAILYMDITDRISYIFVIVMIVLMLIVLKLSRDCKYQQLATQYSQFRLPTTLPNLSHKKEL